MPVNDRLWHEFQRHTDVSKETDRGQIAFTKDQFVDALRCIYKPDIVECLFSDVNNPTQRQSFAYVKRTDKGNYVVVEAVGGKNNPNIVPVEILQVSKTKWDKWIGSGKTIGEMLYQNDPKKLAALKPETNKKNRVIAAQFASDEAIASTPHSPRFLDMVAQEKYVVKQIFEINETGSSRDDGHQENLTDVQPSYGGTPVSDGTIAQRNQKINQKNSLREQAAQNQYTRWLEETEAAKRTYGDFDLGTELQNPQFRKLLRSGVSVGDAYLVSHQEEVFMNAARMGVRLAEEKVNRRVEENRRRPRENGLSPAAAFVTKSNVSKMTRADRLAIARRAAKGERIVF